jgi:hypothetical protein
MSAGVAYLATLAASGGVLGRFLVDLRTRNMRRPTTLQGLAPVERVHLQDELAWYRRIGTTLGALAGVSFGISALALDLVAG